MASEDIAYCDVFMRIALDEARAALAEGEVPVGCVFVPVEASRALLSHSRPNRNESNGHATSPDDEDYQHNTETSHRDDENKHNTPDGDKNNNNHKSNRKSGGSAGDCAAARALIASRGRNATNREGHALAHAEFVAVAALRQRQRPEGPERPEELEWPEEPEELERPERPEELERPERPEELERPEGAEGPGELGEPGGPQRPEGPEELERSQRPAGPERPEESEGPEGPGGPQEIERSEESEGPEGAEGPGSLARLVLYVTVEPCVMCAAMLRYNRVAKVFFGCGNPRFGGNGTVLALHRPIATTATTTTVAGMNGYESVGGHRAEEAVELLQEFYKRENASAPGHKRKRKGNADS